MTATGTGLAARIRELIRHDGPLGVAEYMGLCLLDPEDGYYVRREPFGAEGDFVTAPEISQMFGELIGVWVRQRWLQEGRPAPVRLIELGPGRGTLMADVLRAIRGEPELTSALSIHLVEASPQLADIQRQRLQGAQFPCCWHDRLDAVPGGRSYVLANEFFDALPVRQFQFDGTNWAERVVGLDGDGELVFGLRPRRFDPSEFDLPPVTPAAGSIVEISPQRSAVGAAIGRRIATDGGASLVIDYGHPVSGSGETLQAVRSHRYVDVLAEPGRADLTAHVDFAALAAAYRRGGAKVHPLATQSQFLLAMGLVERAERLGTGQPAAVQDGLRGAVERLAGPDQMGQLFKVFCATGDDAVPYPFDGLV